MTIYVKSYSSALNYTCVVVQNYRVLGNFDFVKGRHGEFQQLFGAIEAGAVPGAAIAELKCLNLYPPLALQFKFRGFNEPNCDFDILSLHRSRFINEFHVYRHCNCVFSNERRPCNQR